MTLLEFAIASVLGDPIRRGVPGESTWDCPSCGKPKFHTLPDLPGQKHRYRCWACGTGGDAYDFLKEQYPREGWSQRKDRLARLSTRYGREVAALVWPDLTLEQRETLARAYPGIRKVARDLEMPAERSPGEDLLLQAHGIYESVDAGSATLEDLARYCWERGREETAKTANQGRVRVCHH